MDSQHDMMPASLLKFGLTSAISGLCKGLSENTALKAECTVFGFEERLPTSQETFIYRLIQELVQNILIHLTRHRNEINLIVAYDGKGMSESFLENEGTGLKNIKQRLEYIKGEMNIESRTGHGTSILIKLPITNEIRKK